MQHQCVALDFPTISQAHTGVESNAIAAQVLGVNGRPIYEIINESSDPNQLDEMGRLLWQSWGDGSISDGEAQYLASCIERRRPLGRRGTPRRSASLLPELAAVSRPGSVHDHPIARRQEIDAGCWAGRADCPTT